jgi:hypothetical protein
MLLAGHGRTIVSGYHGAAGDAGVSTETTAYSLASTIGFLSLHEDIQEEVLEQIQSVVGYDRDPVSRVFLFFFWTK